jgi:hypothetical protein
MQRKNILARDEDHNQEIPKMAMSEMNHKEIVDVVVDNQEAVVATPNPNIFPSAIETMIIVNHKTVTMVVKITKNQVITKWISIHT